MDTQRLILFVIFSFSALFLWEAWQRDHKPPVPVISSAPGAASPSAVDAPRPSATPGMPGASAVPAVPGSAPAAVHRLAACGIEGEWRMTNGLTERRMTCLQR